ncbi:MAG: cyclopropane fatty acyl phospholipid synthase [Pseudomonadota bacterium]
MSEYAPIESEFGNAGFAEKRIRKLLAATGVEINGSNPWDIHVKNPAFYRRVALNGSLGLGESYMDGWWDCERIDELINRLLRSSLASNHRFLSHYVSKAQASLVNLQKKSRAFQVGEEHYDLGNDIYEAMLDSRMVYTCGFWKDATDLDTAQIEKLELVAKKLDLKPGQTVLDIGCGWGSFAKFAAENYGVKVVGITVSKEQVELGMERCKGLPVELRLQDYRDLDDKFDHIMSLGMFEHVGHKNYRDYMKVVSRCLKDGGFFLLHTIGKYESRTGVDPWIAKYIFPNGEIPSLRQISAATEELLVIEDVHNFGPDYDKTLMAWFNNFNATWPTLKSNYSARFYNMWKYYLHACAGAFRARNLQLWQIVISKGDTENAYRRPL